MGQAWTQVVPSHSSMGQGNQFQSQRGIQALSTIQMGQRGKSTGRGQVQGPQARTSGTQGRVYVVVPEDERSDQSDTQGRFLYLHLLSDA